MTNKDPYYDGLGVDAYDALLNEQVVAGDVEFYLDCVKEFGEPVLEIASGTGRVLLPLAEAGCDVTGLELSPAMLAQADARARKRGLTGARLRLAQGDMRDFDLGRQYALIIVPFRSFQHITEPSDQRAALRCFHRHLQPNGHLVLDLFDPRFDLLVDSNASARMVREGNDPAAGKRFRREIVARDVDFRRQVVRERMRIEVRDDKGELLTCEESEWAMRWMQRQEVAYLLELSGFEPIAEYSDFKRTPPVYGREQIWIARRCD